MKNVTGYDMCKLMSGAHGTLGILSEVTIKVLPKAETEQTLLIVGLDEETAINIMTSVSGLSVDVSGFAHLPAVSGDFSSPAPKDLTDKLRPFGWRRRNAPDLMGSTHEGERIAQKCP